MTIIRYDELKDDDKETVNFHIRHSDDEPITMYAIRNLDSYEIRLLTTDFNFAIDSFHNTEEVCEVLITDAYIKELKRIVKRNDFHCNMNRVIKFTEMTNALMSYINERVLKGILPLYKYVDTFNLIKGLRGVLND